MGLPTIEVVLNNWLFLPSSVLNAALRPLSSEIIRLVLLQSPKRLTDLVWI